MKYMIVTSKHHEGFAWDSQYTEYKATRTLRVAIC